MTVTRLGTSGWSYKEWEGVFYPRDNKDKLAFYSKIFRTVEIDSTFYAYPKKAMIQACARITPDDFVFSVRVPKLITHDKKLDVQKGAGEDLMSFLHDLRPIEDAGKLGPIILQLPQGFRYEDGLRRLIDFLGALPADLKFAVEFQEQVLAAAGDLGPAEAVQDRQRHGGRNPSTARHDRHGRLRRNQVAG